MTDRNPAYVAFIQELYADMHARNLRLYVNVGCVPDDAKLSRLPTTSDGMVLMNYDQHEVDSEPGPSPARTGLSRICSACSSWCPSRRSSARWATTAMTGR